MTEPTEQLQPLSEVGIARREAILHAAKRHAFRRRHVRHVARGVACVAVFGITVAIAWSFLRVPHTPDVAPEIVTKQIEPSFVPPVPNDPSPAPDKTPAVTAAPAYATFAFATIETAPGIAGDRLLHTAPATDATISDEELLKSLHNAGVDAGLATVGSRSMVIVNDNAASLR